MTVLRPRRTRCRGRHGRAGTGLDDRPHGGHDLLTADPAEQGSSQFGWSWSRYRLPATAPPQPRAGGPACRT